MARVRHQRVRSRSGQALVEYVVMVGLLLATVSILALFLFTFKEFGARILALVASEFP